MWNLYLNYYTSVPPDWQGKRRQIIHLQITRQADYLTPLIKVSKMKQQNSAVEGMMKKYKILMAEDDLSLINGLTFAMKKQGYEVDVARTSLETDALWGNGDYDLVILDVSLPDGSGFDICRNIRKTSKVPIMFLTAADEENDIIMGLDIGADDYITKPFKLAVFLSRINALLRRSTDFSQTDTQLSSNGITVFPLKGEGYKNGQSLELTSGEYKLLCLFMENPNTVLSAEQILGRLWDCDENFIDNKTLAVYIRRLRMKIEDDPGRPTKIVTMRGMGYKWNTEGSRSL